MSFIQDIKQKLIPLVVCLSTFCVPKPVISAERLVFSLPALGDFTVSVKSLEDFAQKGKINRDLAYYTQYLDEETINDLQKILQKKFDYDRVTVYRLTNTAMGEAFLKRLGQVIQVERNTNGFYALRSSLITAAGDVQGLTLINVLRQFPAQDLRLNTDILRQMVEELTALDEYRQAAIKAIATVAENQAQSEAKLNLTQLRDLRQLGAYQVTKKTLTLEIEEIRQTTLGIRDNYELKADIYLPENAKQQIPLVVISHGFGSFRGKNDLPRHLASHGLAVAVPEHIGSDLKYRQALLAGEIRTDISPMEYLSRPLDITYLIDQLQKLSEADPQWRGKIDFNKVGVTGNSLGGTTTLSLAGAEINYPRLSHQCEQENVFLNVSLLLQCRASYLPPLNYNLKDDRVKAAVASNPLSSALFGPEGLEKIDIPTLILAGSEDIITPVVAEQIHPFIWLNKTDKYLSLLVPGTHFTASLQSRKGTEAIPDFLLGNNYEQGRQYYYGLAVAFFQYYLADKSEYLPYLTASYGESISNDNLRVYQIESLTPERLITAYQNEPPKPIIPEPVVEALPPREETILAEIQRTGVLKVGIRTDAIPFGYIDNQEDSLTGYCDDFVSDFAQNLQAQLNLNTEVEIVKIYSHLDNRYQLVKDGTVHLECGPNTITDKIGGVNFSKAFFVTGTHFLVEKKQANRINPNQRLRGVNIGALKNTTTATFLGKKYPEANLVFFEGDNAREDAILALSKSEIDALANDGVLLVGEMVKQDLPEDNYTLVPKKPLTCDFYGLILPADDPEWETTVNNFIDGKDSLPTWDKWFTSLFPYVLLNLDYCLNR